MTSSYDGLPLTMLVSSRSSLRAAAVLKPTAETSIAAFAGLCETRRRLCSIDIAGAGGNHAGRVHQCNVAELLDKTKPENQSKSLATIRKYDRYNKMWLSTYPLYVRQFRNRDLPETLSVQTLNKRSSGYRLKAVAIFAPYVRFSVEQAASLTFQMRMFSKRMLLPLNGYISCPARN
jgi:hypothetical protein